MVDSDGLLKWAPHNLQRYSEEFNNSTWVKSGTSVTANAATAPNGELLADLLYPTSSGGLIYNVEPNTDPYNISCFVKSAGFSWVAIGTNTNSADISWFNLGSGVVGTVGSNMASSSITSIGDGWYLCSTTTTTAVGGNAQMAMWPTDGDGSRDSTPNGTDGLYIWGAHCHKSDLGGMVNNPARGDSYVPTTSSAVYLPRVGHHVYNGSAWVNEGILHESEARTNLVYSSGGTGWQDTQLMQTENAGLSPDGTSNAMKITPSGSYAGLLMRYIYRSLVRTPDTDYISSVYLASAGFGFATLSIYSGGGSYNTIVVDLSDGTITANYTLGTQGSLADTFSVEPAGSNFYRVIVKNSGHAYIIIGISDTATYDDVVGSFGFKGTAIDGGSGILVYGLQTEITQPHQATSQQQVQL
tara:strand:- start:36 stop:1274 length:1239 start_codon:yes stop_codon:yes gene_type:complete